MNLTWQQNASGRLPLGSRLRQNKGAAAVVRTSVGAGNDSDSIHFAYHHNSSDFTSLCPGNLRVPRQQFSLANFLYGLSWDSCGTFVQQESNAKPAPYATSRHRAATCFMSGKPNCERLSSHPKLAATFNNHWHELLHRQSACKRRRVSILNRLGLFILLLVGSFTLKPFVSPLFCLRKNHHVNI